MSETTVLDLVTRIDIAPLKAGMTAAADSVSASTGEMSASMVDVDRTLNELQATMSGVTAKEIEMGEAGAEAGKKMASSFRESREAAMLLGEETGVRIPRALSSIAAHSAVIGPILETAFSGVAILAFADLAVRAGEKLSDWVAETFIFTAADKALNAQLLTTNKTIGENAAKVSELKSDFDLIGLSGLDKTNEQLMQMGDRMLDLQAKERALRDNIFATNQGWLEGGESVAALSNRLGEVQSNETLLNQEIQNLLKLGAFEKQAQDTAEWNKQLAILQHGLDAVTKSTGETFSPKGKPQTAGVGSEGTDIAKLTEQESTVDKLLEARRNAELKTATAGAEADKEAGDKSIAAAIKTEEGYEASLRGQAKFTEDSYDQQIDQLERLAGRKKITWAAESSAVQGLYQQEEAALQVSLDKQIDAAIATAQLEAAKRNEVLSEADARELASVQKLEQDKSVIREQFRKKEQDAEFKANQEMEKSVNDFVSEGTSAFNNFLITITTTKGKGSEFRFLAEEWQKVVFGMEKDFLQMILRTAETTPVFTGITTGLKNTLANVFSKIGLGPAAGAGANLPAGAASSTAQGVATATTTGAGVASQAPQAALATSLTTLTPVITSLTAAESAQLAAITPLNAEFLVMTTTLTSLTAALAAASVAVSTDTAAETAEAVAIGVDTAASAAQTPAIMADTAATIIHTAALGFDEGGYVPRTGMAVLHAGERVATPDMWSEIGQMGKQNGDSGGGHTFNVHHHTSVNALDGADVSKILRKNSSKVGKELMRAIKSGSLRLPR